MQRSYFCSDQISYFPFDQLTFEIRATFTFNKVNPKKAAYIDALTECASENSKIASIDEMRNYWKYLDEDQISSADQDCRKTFWTSNKPLNSTHIIFDEGTQETLFNENENLDLQKHCLAKFDTMKLVAGIATDDKHLCICVLYEIRKVYEQFL